ncbi:C-type lectin domain family 10 member A-like [Scyliorhinus canicula]|uniref:C-type lectin domain family 10 member A-like n=1 Tax=Scyliorhinus canicula TaxID=7830 RepID=UPI0018F3F67A|nr:C-type lectin domain family 10 member A-like [Scyliorhinus canicula]
MTILEELRRRVQGLIPTIVTSVILLILVICLFYLLFKTWQLERKYDQMWGTSQSGEGVSKLRADVRELDQGYIDLKAIVSQLDETYSMLLAIKEKSAQLHRTAPEIRRLLGSLIFNQYNFICPEGWSIHGGHCFFFSSDIMDWYGANSSCTQANAVLAIINSLTLQNFITHHDSINRWIGLTDLEQVGVYRWVNGTPLVTG